MRNNRIAIFASTSGHSGVDRALKNLVPELVARGYLVDQLKVRKHGPDIECDSPNFRELDLGVSSTYISVFGLAKYLKQSKPAVLFSDKDRVNRTALAAKYLSGADPRLVFSSGTTISIDLSHKSWSERVIQRWSMGNLYQKAYQVVVDSKGVADDMSEYTGLNRSLIKVVPRPVIQDSMLLKKHEAPDHPWFKKHECPIVLGVGELSDRKDFATLIRALHLIDSPNPPRLVILGKGRNKQSLMELAASLGLSERVDFAGYASNPYSYMAHADVFAQTSRWEGLGFALIEALAVGTPSVSTNAPSGPAEVLDNGKYGPLVDVGDYKKLSECITDLLSASVNTDLLKEAAKPYTVSAATDACLEAMGLPLRV